MIVLHTTAACSNTPRVVMALEEFGRPYRLELHADGYFDQAFGRKGPMLEEGDLRMFEPHAMLRYVAQNTDPRVDEWLDSILTRVRPAVLRFGNALGSQSSDLAAARAALEVELAHLDAVTPSEGFMLGDLTVVDCALTLLTNLAAFGVELTSCPRLHAYTQRLLAHPSHVRARASLTNARKPK